MKDRGLYWDNMSKAEFLEECSPNERVVLNSGREHYESDLDYAEALLTGVYDEPVSVGPSPLGVEVKVFEGVDEAVSISSEGEFAYYGLRPGVEFVAAEVFNSLVVGGETRNVQAIERYGVEDLDVFLENVLGESSL